MHLLIRAKKGKRMIELLVMLAFLTALFWLGFHVTGALLSAMIWLFFKLPFALVLGFLGLICCATILLIPLGRKCFKFAFEVLT